MSIASPRELYDAVSEAMRLRHLSLQTKKTYLGVIRDFVRFHGRKNPAKMGVAQPLELVARAGCRSRYPCYPCCRRHRGLFG
jgi:hypothetical protein